MKKYIFMILVLIFSLLFLYSNCKKKEIIPKNPKIYVIGLDGADWDIIDPLIKKGKLKFFKKLKEESAWARLKSFKPTLSAVVWTSIATGKTMIKHGIVDWLFVNKNNIKVPYSNSEKRVPSIWEIFDYYSKRSVVVSWFVTYPPDHIDGVIVSDSFNQAVTEVFLAKKNFHAFESTVYPAIYYKKLYGLLDKDYKTGKLNYKEIIKNMGIPDYIQMYKDRYKENNVLKIPILRHWKAFILKEYTTSKVINYLLYKKKYDLFMGYFRMPDIFKHFCSMYLEKDYLKAINKKLNKGKISIETQREFETKIADVVEPILRSKENILKKIYYKAKKENAYIFILSDHGFALPKGGYNHYGLPENIPAPDGILMIIGPGVQKNKKIKSSVFDITPTILYLSGKPIGKQMDGKPLVNAFDFRKNINYKIYKKLKTIKHKKNKTLNKKTIDDLKTLGYIN